MENKMKNAAEGIVIALATSDEPYYIIDDICYCTLCPTKGHEDDDRVAILVPNELTCEDGLSVMGHCKECAWRQAVEYVSANVNPSTLAKHGRRK